MGLGIEKVNFFITGQPIIAGIADDPSIQAPRAYRPEEKPEGNINVANAGSGQAHGKIFERSANPPTGQSIYTDSSSNDLRGDHARYCELVKSRHDLTKRPSATTTPGNPQSFTHQQPNYNQPLLRA